MKRLCKFFASLCVMLMLGITIFSGQSWGSNACSGLVLSKGATVDIATGVFPGIVHDGNRIVISYASGNDLYVRPYDTQFNPLAAATRITNVGNVTDHKHIFFQGYHYITYSTIADKDLYLIKLDTGFNQVGTTVTVTANSTTTFSNDMLLGQDSTHLITGQFRPSDKNGGQSSGHLIKRYDADLNYIAPDIVANAFAHTNTASIGLIRDMIYIVAPSTPIQGGQVRTQRNLLLLRFDKTTWAAKDSTAITLVDSNSMTHANDGDGIWMSTGLTYDTGNACMFVGHTFSNGAGGSDGGDIYLRVFDGNTLTQTYSEVMVSSTSANRVHFLLGDNTLYAVYDENAVIKALKYTLTYAKTSKLTGSDFNNDGKTDVLLQNSQTWIKYNIHGIFRVVP
ncbi:MAG: hypothetical protein SFH39_14035 [Candidatus Magnetobacterium sp. LHC-1]|nr:hypothetical protein [Nitrospirota bacterium]